MSKIDARLTQLERLTLGNNGRNPAALTEEERIQRVAAILDAAQADPNDVRLAAKAERINSLLDRARARQGGTNV